MNERRFARDRRSDSQYEIGYRAGKEEVRGEYQRVLLWAAGIVIFGVFLPVLISFTIPDSVRESEIEDKVGFLMTFLGTAIATLGTITPAIQKKYLGNLSFFTWGSAIGSFLCILAVMFMAGNSLRSFGIPLSGFLLVIVSRVFIYIAGNHRAIIGTLRAMPIPEKYVRD
jgi:hypothetical protein